MKSFLQRAEWFGCCQASRTANSISHCSWGISASFPVDSCSKLTTAIAGFCCAIWIVKPRCCLSQHAHLMLVPLRLSQFWSTFTNELSCVAGRRVSVHALQLLCLLSEGFCQVLGIWLKPSIVHLYTGALEMLPLTTALTVMSCVFLLWSHPSHKYLNLVINHAAQSSNF